MVALVADLMDRSRISAALPDVECTNDAQDARGADVVIVDLGRLNTEIATLRGLIGPARLIAYGAHVDEEALERARADGADLALPRSRFFRDPAAVVQGDY